MSAGWFERANFTATLLTSEQLLEAPGVMIYLIEAFLLYCASNGLLEQILGNLLVLMDAHSQALLVWVQVET